MSTNSNNTVNTNKQGSTSTVPATKPTTPSSTSALNAQSSGQALAGALWEALSELTDAYNECIDVYRKMGLQAIQASNDMTTYKAQADQNKSNDTAAQMRYDAIAQGVGAGITIGGLGFSFVSNLGASKEMDGIENNLTKLNSKLTTLDTPPANPPRLLQGPNPDPNAPNAPNAPVEANRFADIPEGHTRFNELTNGNMERYTNDPANVHDKAVYDRLNTGEQTAIKENIKKQIKSQEDRKGMFASIQNQNQTKGQMFTQFGTAGANSIAGGLKSQKQIDIGQQEYNSNLDGNGQQQWNSMIGTAASAQSKMADSSNQAIQAYTQMEQSNANPNR